MILDTTITALIPFLTFISATGPTQAGPSGLGTGNPPIMPASNVLDGKDDISDKLKTFYFFTQNKRDLINDTLKTIKEKYKEFGNINRENVKNFVETFHLVFKSDFCCLLMEEEFRKFLVEMYSQLFKFYWPNSLCDIFYEAMRVVYWSFCGDALIELVKYSLEKKDFSIIKNLNLLKATHFMVELHQINKNPKDTLKYIDILLRAEQEMKPDEMEVKTKDGTQGGNATRMRNFFKNLQTENFEFLEFLFLPIMTFFSGTRTEFEKKIPGEEKKEFTFAEFPIEYFLKEMECFLEHYRAEYSSSLRTGNNKRKL